ncbi:MAG TPA: trypsin-like peptidase domain-containing protein [Nocardioidaceae bacterium]|nr:trypsin-like peptidase domain-containing protein [Nocardioidaceae bacterium]
MSEHDGPGGSDDEPTRPVYYEQQGPYGYPYGQMPVQPYGYSQPPSRVPGWLWPVVAATALVVGLLGGTIGGALVSSTMDGGAGAIFTDTEAAPPLDPENGSVAAVAKQLLPSTVQILARNGQGGATGSGFVVDRRGHVITNNHVVGDAAAGGKISVIDHEGRSHEAEIVGRSPVYDIAVLEIDDGRDLRPAALGSSTSMNVGETVVAIGSPLGLDSTVTSGIVSAIDRPVTTGDQDDSSYINALQTDAAINPGNSGGPLVNLRGEVVGVNSAIATMGGGFGAESGNIGVGFAIPMEQVKVTAAQILDTGQAKYPVIGANVNTGSRRDGAEVVDVPSGTPAAEAGLQEGDVVVAVDDVAVTDGIGLIVAIRSHQPGETVALKVRRDGRELTVRVELDAKVG